MLVTGASGPADHCDGPDPCPPQPALLRHLLTELVWQSSKAWYSLALPPALEPDNAEEATLRALLPPASDDGRSGPCTFLNGFFDS